MPDNRQGKTKSGKPAESAQEPRWKQPPPHQRSAPRTSQQAMLRVRLRQVKRILSGRKARPTPPEEAARRRAAVHVPWQRVVLLPLLVAVTFASVQFFTRDQFYVF